jgi:DNA-binding response OmpR family regulator
MEILIIEDDAAVRGGIRKQLEKEGADVTEAGDATSARRALAARSFDVVLLDLTLPDQNGSEILKELRQSGSTTQVIVVSGATTEADRVRSLLAGADDYVVKPFFPRELAARVVAASHRFHLSGDRVMCFNTLEIDLTSRQVRVDGEPTELTVKEFDLLAFLAARPGHIFSREELLRSVWHSKSDWQGAATVTEHVRRLRAKIQPDGSGDRLISTVRGLGYRFDPPRRRIEAYAR